MQAGGISGLQSQGRELLFVGDLSQTIGLLDARWDFRHSTKISAALPTALFLSSDCSFRNICATDG